MNRYPLVPPIFVVLSAKGKLCIRDIGKATAGKRLRLAASRKIRLKLSCFLPMLPTCDGIEPYIHRNGTCQALMVRWVEVFKRRSPLNYYIAVWR